MSLLQRFCRTVLYKRMHWRAEISVEFPEKYILCLAPHTSNWDFIMGLLYSRAENLKINFLMNKEWFFWPLGVFFRSIGGIPVYRGKHTSMTDALAETARNTPHFRLCVTPEGTRSLNPEWKKGFYFIALKANIPILLYGLDFERKLIECKHVIVPTGDVEADMKKIKSYFKDFKGKKPELFTVGDI